MTLAFVSDELRGLLDPAPAPVVIVDEAGRVAFVNARAEGLFGYGRAEVLGRPVEVLIPEWPRPERPGGPASEYGRRKDGAEFPVHIDRNRLGSEGQFVLAVIAEAPDAARPPDEGDREPAEGDVRRDAARFRALFKSAAVGVVEYSPDGHILGANDAFCRMLGYTPAELRAMGAADVLFPDDHAPAAAPSGAGGPAASYEAERQYRRKDGSAVWARVSAVTQEEGGAPARVSAVVVDLTERKRAEEQFWHAQKVGAAGLLATGTAHDCNNLLTVINGYTQLLLDELPDAAPTRELVRQMATACQRAAGLTAQLLAFGRKSIPEPRTLDLNEVVSRAARLVRPLLGERVALVTDLTADPALVTADPTQLEQVILNLAVNARDAMPHGGRLTVATRDLWRRDGGAPDRPRRYVLLTVADTGVGMTDEVRERIFEPFFTTKDVGKGTGLGLAVVHGAVTRYGGLIDVSSKPGAGTTIKILLPAAAGPP